MQRGVASAQRQHTAREGSKVRNRFFGETSSSPISTYEIHVKAAYLSFFGVQYMAKQLG